MSDFGLMYYNARWYDPYLNRFTQPDSIIPNPGNPQDWDRFSYARNNPIRYNDPSGHAACSGLNGECKNSIGKVINHVSQRIVSRREWGALEPGSRPNTEGLYSSDNEGGYAPYSELIPGKSLSEILETIVIHHEGDYETYDVWQVQKTHMDRGYYDIGYHYIVGQDGQIYEGRDVTVRGAHVLEANTGRIGVLWLGDFQPGHDFGGGDIGPTDPTGHDDPRPTDAQIRATMQLVAWFDNIYGISRVEGHHQVNPDSCPPSNAIPFIPILNNVLFR